MWINYWFDFIQLDSIWFNFIKFCFIWFTLINLIHFDSFDSLLFISFNLIQHDSIWFYLIQFHSTNFIQLVTCLNWSQDSTSWFNLLLFWASYLIRLVTWQNTHTTSIIRFILKIIHVWTKISSSWSKSKPQHAC